MIAVLVQEAQEIGGGGCRCKGEEAKYGTLGRTNGDGDPDLPSGDGNYRCGGE